MRFAALLLLVASALVAQPCQPVVITDSSGGTNGAVPTGTTLNASLHGGGSANWAWGTNFAHNDITYATAAHGLIYGTTSLCNGGAYTDSSTLGLQFVSTGASVTWMELDFPTNQGTLANGTTGQWFSTNILASDTCNIDMNTVQGVPLTSGAGGFNNTIVFCTGSQLQLKCEGGGTINTCQGDAVGTYPIQLTSSLASRVWITLNYVNGASTTSSTSVAIGTGAQTFTVASCSGITVGDRIRAYSNANQPGSSSPQQMEGVATSCSGSTLIMSVDTINWLASGNTPFTSSGTFTDWKVTSSIFRAKVYAEDPNHPGAVGGLIGGWSMIYTTAGGGKPVYIVLGDSLGGVPSGRTMYFDHIKACSSTSVSGCQFPMLPDSYPSTGIIDQTRTAKYWPSAGAGTIPTNRTQCGSTIAAYTGTASTINTALSGCGANQYVLLGSGTFTLSTAISFPTSSNNISLKGFGSNQTFVMFTSAGQVGCPTNTASVCVKNADADVNPDNVANWTAGYTQGSTTLTLGANTTGSTKPSVGTVLRLYQASDGTTETNNIKVCSTSGNSGCTTSGASDPQNSQIQLVTVVSITGGSCPCTVTFTPGLYAPNWRSSQNPAAYWSNSAYLTGIGIEDISFDFSADTGGNTGITWFNVANSWEARLRLINAKSKNSFAYQTVHLTRRDSYQFGIQNSTAGPNAYGYDTINGCDNLIENNIIQAVTAPITEEQAACGNVSAYNYSINDANTGDTTFATGQLFNHAGLSHYDLAESNDGLGIVLDQTYGQSIMFSDFRNRWSGYENDGRTGNTVPVIAYNLDRFSNHVGNVLGYAGYATTYQTNTGDSTTNCNTSVWTFGLGGNCANGGSGGFPPNDTLELSTTLRWGNYDVVNSAVRNVSSEVPSGFAPYGGSVPASNSLPASFYLSAQPPFWGTQPWPAIGPDVTGGNVANVGGFAYKIPARVCFETTMGGTFGDSSPRAFNPNVCYYGASPSSSGTSKSGPYTQAGPRTSKEIQ